MADYYIPSSEGIFDENLGRLVRLHISEETDIIKNASTIALELQTQGTSEIVRNAIDTLSFSEELILSIGSDIEEKHNFKWTLFNKTTEDWEVAYFSTLRDKPAKSQFTSRLKSDSHYVSHLFDGSLTLNISFKVKFRPEGSLIAPQFYVAFNEDVEFTHYDLTAPQVDSESTYDIIPIFENGEYKSLRFNFKGRCGHSTKTSTLRIELYFNSSATRFARLYDLPAGYTYREFDIPIDWYPAEFINNFYPYQAKVTITRKDAPLSSEYMKDVEFHNWVTEVNAPISISTIKKNEEGTQETINYILTTYADVGSYNPNMHCTSSDESKITVDNFGKMTLLDYTDDGVPVVITISSTDELIPQEIRPYAIVLVYVLRPFFPSFEDYASVMDVNLLNKFLNAIEYIKTVYYEKSGITLSLLSIIFESYAHDPRDIHTLLSMIHYNIWVIQNTFLLTDVEYPKLSTIEIPISNTGAPYYWADIVGLWIGILTKSNQVLNDM